MLNSDILVSILFLYSENRFKQFNFQPRFHVCNLRACAILKKGHVITSEQSVKQNTTYVTDILV